MAVINNPTDINSLQNVAGGTYMGKNLDMTTRITDSARGMIDMYKGTDFMTNPNFLRDFEIFKKAYPGQEGTLMNLLQGQTASTATDVVSGILPEVAPTVVLEGTSQALPKLSPIGFEGMPEAGLNLIEQNISPVQNVAASKPGAFGIRNLFRGESGLDLAIQRGKELTSTMSPAQVTAASSALALVRPQDWMSDDDPTTVTGREVMGRGLQFAKGLATMPLNPMQGIIDMVSAPAGLVRDLVTRKKTRSAIQDQKSDELLADISGEQTSRQTSRYQSDLEQKLKYMEDMGVNTADTTFAKEGAQVGANKKSASHDYLSEDYKKFLAMNFKGGGNLEGTRPEMLKYSYDTGGNVKTDTTKTGGTKYSKDLALFNYYKNKDAAYRASKENPALETIDVGPVKPMGGTVDFGMLGGAKAIQTFGALYKFLKSGKSVKDFFKMKNISEGERNPEHFFTKPLEKGGRAVGPSHSNGGIPGFTKDGGMVEFEGNEMIFSKKDSNVIEKLKRGGDVNALGKYVSQAMDNWPDGY